MICSLICLLGCYLHGAARHGKKRCESSCCEIFWAKFKANFMVEVKQRVNTPCTRVRIGKFLRRVLEFFNLCALRKTLLLLLMFVVVVRCYELENMEISMNILSELCPIERRPSKRLRRDTFSSVTSHLSNFEFRSAFHVTRKLINMLLLSLISRL